MILTDVSFLKKQVAETFRFVVEIKDNLDNVRETFWRKFTGIEDDLTEIKLKNEMLERRITSLERKKDKTPDTDKPQDLTRLQKLIEKAQLDAIKAKNEAILSGKKANQALSKNKFTESRLTNIHKQLQKTIANTRAKLDLERKKSEKRMNDRLNKIYKEWESRKKIIDKLSKDFPTIKKLATDAKKIAEKVGTNLNNFKTQALGNIASLKTSVTLTEKQIQLIWQVLAAAGLVQGAISLGISISQIMSWQKKKADNQQGSTSNQFDIIKINTRLDAVEFNAAKNYDYVNQLIQFTRGELILINENFKYYQGLMDRTIQFTRDELYQSKNNFEILKKRIDNTIQFTRDELFKVNDNFKIINDKVAKMQANIDSVILDFKSTITDLKKSIALQIEAINIKVAAMQASINDSIAKINQSKIDFDAKITEINIVLKGTEKIKPDVLAIINPKLDKLNTRIDNIRTGGGENININMNEIANKLGYKLDKYRTDNFTLQRELDTKWNKTMEQFNRETANDLTAFEKALQEQGKEFSKLAALQQKAAQGDKFAQQEISEIMDKKIKDFWDGNNDFEKLKIRQNEIIKEQEQQKKLITTPNPTINNPALAPLEARITTLDLKIKEREKVDIEANKKLDLILPAIPTIMGIVPAIGRVPNATANLINPNIPTVPQIGAKVNEVVCNPQCQLPSIGATNNAAQGIKQDIGNKINNANNALQTGMLAEILKRIGDFIPGGLSGWMGKFTKWNMLNRIVSYMTLAATIHNAAQLSSNIGVTLIQAMQNIIDTFGLKDANDKEYNLQELINNSIKNVVEGIIGAENLANFKTSWAKYSRIYQSGANLFQSMLSMGDTMINAVQIISGQNAKIGNALKMWGVVGEKAYGWMNITPNFNNPLLTKLQSLEETASTVEQVSQEPLNVKSAVGEVKTNSEELANSWEQNGTAKQGAELPEAKKVKADMDTKKIESEGIFKSIQDAFEDDDE